MIAIDLSKQQELDAEPTVIQHINFTANVYRAENSTMFFIIEEAKETVFLRYCKSIVNILQSVILLNDLIFISVK